MDAMKAATQLPPGFQPLEPSQTQWKGDRDSLTVVPVEENSACAVYDDGVIELAGEVIRLTFNDLFSKAPDVRATAVSWFLDTESLPASQGGGMSFQWICESTGTERSYLLRKLREEAVAKAEQKCLKRKDLLPILMERLAPFLHPENGKGDRS
jgi:hypothetical protein